MSVLGIFAVAALWVALWQLFVFITLNRIHNRRWERFWNGD